MPGGDLLKFLRDAKRDHGPTLLTLPEQIQVALDVAHGCQYLAQQHFIHRDIAARNCLVSSKGADRVVKIGGKYLPVIVTLGVMRCTFNVVFF